jgi:Histidinol-phosphate/aromatic aminotransferase and cobyric acid decarboxylase
LRLGFVIADMDIAARLRERRGAWPLHSAALAIGTKALRDEVWQNNARQILRKARHRLDDVLAPHMAILGGTDLFRLGDVSDAGSLFTHLGTHGILTRIFDYNPRWIRFGLPPDDTGFIRLQSALDAFAKDRL